MGGKIVSEMTALQRKMTDVVIKDEMKAMSVDIGEIDAEGDGGVYEPAKDDEGIIVDAVIEEKNDAAAEPSTEGQN